MRQGGVRVLKLTLSSQVPAHQLEYSDAISGTGKPLQVPAISTKLRILAVNRSKLRAGGGMAEFLGRVRELLGRVAGVYERCA